MIEQYEIRRYAIIGGCVVEEAILWIVPEADHPKAVWVTLPQEDTRKRLLPVSMANILGAGGMIVDDYYDMPLRCDALIMGADEYQERLPNWKRLGFPAGFQ